MAQIPGGWRLATPSTMTHLIVARVNSKGQSVPLGGPQSFGRALIQAERIRLSGKAYRLIRVRPNGR